jgi:hypothetical protein
VRDFDYTVGSIVPACFESYARVFHPATRNGPDGPIDVRWSEVARAYGRTMHPLAEWGSLTGTWRHEPRQGDPLWEDAPATGGLPDRQTSALREVLAQHTGTPERCWFAVWEGYDPGTLTFLVDREQAGSQRAEQAIRARKQEHAAAAERLNAAARFLLPNRPMRLLSGPLGALGSGCVLDRFALAGQSPNLYWPEDRAWCVGSEIDLKSTYIGGSAACIQAILAEARLEALPASVDQLLTWDSDRVNPLPEPPGSGSV